jgi:hypothetical protein
MNLKFLLFAGMLLFGSMASVSAQNTTSKKMLRHVVLFKFKDSATPAQVKEVEDAFRKVPTQIKEVKGFEWGTNNSPEGLAQGFTHAFLVSFESEAARESLFASSRPQSICKSSGTTSGQSIGD